MKKKIVIIGAGQLGSRHLQGILKSDRDISIEIIEPSEKARINVTKRIEELGLDKKEVSFVNHIEHLSNNVYLAIVATNSDIRYKVTSELLKSKKVKFLILEKVLFQDLEHYKSMKEILDRTETRCWVNHPRRCFPLYKDLKEQLNECVNYHFSVSGGDWGLGCNTLHFLDLISYLTGDDSLSLSLSLLDPEVKETKRSSFIELSGAITGFSEKSRFIIESFNTKSPMQITITTDLFNIFIDESRNWARIVNNKTKEVQVIESKITYYQSELTNFLLEDLIDFGNCDLTPYDEACAIHSEFIGKLLIFLKEKVNKMTMLCPVT